MLGKRIDQRLLLTVARELEHQVTAAGRRWKHRHAREVDPEAAGLLSDRFERRPNRLGRRVAEPLDERSRLLELLRRDPRDDRDESVAHDCLRKVTTSSSMKGPTNLGRPTSAMPRATSRATNSGS